MPQIFYLLHFLYLFSSVGFLAGWVGLSQPVEGLIGGTGLTTPRVKGEVPRLAGLELGQEFLLLPPTFRLQLKLRLSPRLSSLRPAARSPQPLMLPDRHDHGSQLLI